MESQTSAGGRASGDLARRFTGKYLSLTSFKRDGTGVATPVWFVPDNGRLLVLTDADSFKARRIRRNPDITIAPCSASGHVRGAPVAAHAELLPQTEVGRVEGLIARKYRVDRILILPIYRLVMRLRGRRERGRSVGVAITAR
jgi:uncharacterized protein